MIFCGVIVATIVHEGAVMITLPAFAPLIVVPPVIAYHSNRKRIFSLMTRLFEGAQSIEDGAFMAALLDQESLEVGHAYWLPLDDGSEDRRYPGR